MGTVKALIPAVALTGVVSGILASGGTRGGVLALEHATLAQHSFYWSWPLFLVTAGIARALLWMMEA